MHAFAFIEYMLYVWLCIACVFDTGVDIQIWGGDALVPRGTVVDLERDGVSSVFTRCRGG